MAEEVIDDSKLNDEEYFNKYNKLRDKAPETEVTETENTETENTETENTETGLGQETTETEEKTETTTETTEEKVPTVEEILKREFGEDYKDIPTLKTQFQTYKEKETKYQQTEQLATLFEDKNLLKVLQASKDTKIKDLSFLEQVINADFTSKDLDPIGVLIMQEKLTDPEVDVEGLREILNDRYDLSKPEGEEWDDLDPEKQREITKRINNNKFELNKAVKTAKQEITTLRDKIKIPEFNVVDEVKVQKLVNDWKPKLQAIETTIKDIEFKDADGTVYKIPLPEKSVELIKQTIANSVIPYISNNMLEASDVSVGNARKTVEAALLSMNRDFFLAKAMEEGFKRGQAKAMGTVYNPKPPKGKPGSQGAAKPKTDEEKHYEKMNLLINKF